MENAEIIENIESTNNISLGSKVTVECLEDGEKEEYQIVGSQEANPLQGRISDDSPIGRGLLGHTAGDTVTIEAPAGAISYRVISIE